MERLVQTIFFCCLIGATLARTEIEIKKWFIQQAVECSKEHPVTGEELQQMKTKHKIPESISAKCLVACIFKRIEWIDAKGMFDKEKAIKLSEKDYANDQVKLDKARELYEFCSKVNSETVSDGEQGCERSNILAICLTDNAAQHGFVLQ